MLRLALLIVLWLTPAAALAQPSTSAFIPSPTGRPMEVPTVFFFQQLRMACQATVRDREEALECTSRAKYLRITASRMNLQIAAAYSYRYLQMYDDLREVWRRIMDDNIKLAAGARLLLEKYPQVRAFVRNVPAREI